MHNFLCCLSYIAVRLELHVDKWLSTVVIWVCSTGAAIAMQRWVWAAENGVDP